MISQDPLLQAIINAGGRPKMKIEAVNIEDIMGKS